MMKKVFFVSLGCLSLALGVVGIVLPVLPTVPFFLLTAFCFAKSSARLHCWFLGTTLYKKYIGSYIKRKGMTLRAKLALIGTVTALMALGFVMMSRVPVGRIILGIVWAGHILYFGFVVKTISQEEADAAVASAQEEWTVGGLYLLRKSAIMGRQKDEKRRQHHVDLSAAPWQN